MEFGKAMDVSAFDWDDTALIKAYDRVMKTTKKGLLKSKNSKTKDKENIREENAAKPWEKGDYCRAIYQEDELLYEATILEIHGDTCLVEYLGYGDVEEVSLDRLEESLGKKARQKQRKEVKKAENASDTDFSHGTESRERYKSAKPGHHHHNQNIPEHYDSYNTQHQEFQQPIVFNHSSAHPHAFDHPHVTAGPVQRIRDDSHCMPPPPPPPMPPCSVAKDPALNAMLVSWYMAGYYTGLHQNQKSSHSCSAGAAAFGPSNCCEHHYQNHYGQFY